jgi:radical SAM enzyme (TIGR01210 family)
MEFKEDLLVKEGKIVLSKVMKKIRLKTLSESLSSGHYLIPSENGLKDQALFWLPSRGCSYALSNGGCTMCDFGGCSREMTEEQMINELKKQLNHPDINGKPILNFGGQGSFFDDLEFSPKLRKKILEEISKRNWIKTLTCESRPEFITEEKIKQFRKLMGRRWLEIGIGNESSNSLIREGIINKGLNKKDYKKMFELARKYEVWISHHIILKPLVLTEKEAIKDAVNTIKDILKDVDETHPTLRVILMAMNIKPNTLIGWAYNKKVYAPPLLWSCIEVLKKLTPLEREYVKVLGFDTGVTPLAYIGNGDGTDKKILIALKQFDRDHKILHLLRLEDKFKTSQSRKEWEKRMLENPKDLRDRLKDFYRLLINEFPEEFNKEEFKTF